MQSIKSKDYSIFFNDDAYEALNKYMSSNQHSSIFILTDENTNEYCFPSFMERFATDIPTEVIEIEAGEIHKNIDTCTSLWNVLSELGADRKSLIINLGGGMITDLGGFVASTFKRGISFINIPTSLLSMVDASVGGKTGIDLGNLKNQVGMFSNPEMVLIDVEFLATLDEREVKSGMAEIIKYGLTFNTDLWLQVLNYKELTINDFSDVVFQSINIKNDVVLKDPNEQNLRKVLNFGHTLGHAIESYYLTSATKETLTHGEAIAVGMVAACYISSSQLSFPLEKTSEIKNLIIELFGKVDISLEDYAPILELLKHDKKNVNSKIQFVLLNALESFQLNCEVSEELMRESLDFYIN